MLKERELYLCFETRETCKSFLGLCPQNLKNLEELCLEVYVLEITGGPS